MPVAVEAVVVQGGKIRVPAPGPPEFFLWGGTNDCLFFQENGRKF